MENRSLLDSHTPEAIIKLFSELSDCTSEMVELIKNSGQHELKKVRKVFLQVENYEIGEIYELTRAANRGHRQNSTYLILSKIRVLCRKRCEFEKIEEMYNSVFCVRSRDVNAVIRGMCVEFLSQWMLDNEILWKKEYLRYLVWGLEDRSELVRKKALRGILKIFTKACKHNNIKSNTPNLNLATTGFYEQCGNKILEMTQEEPGAIIKLARETVYFVFAKHGFYNETQILSVLSSDNEIGRWRREALQRLCPAGMWDLERLHSLAVNVGAQALRGLCSDTDEMVQLVQCIDDTLAQGRVCCKTGRLCLLDILAIQQLAIDPGLFKSLLERTKDSTENTAAIIECLVQMNILREHGGETRQLLGILEQRVLQRPSLTKQFMKLLHVAQTDFEDEVLEIIERLKVAIRENKEFSEIALIPLIQAYDVTDIIDESSKSVVKCYAALWMIYSGCFYRILDVKFTDVEDFLTLTEFLIFFYTHIDKSLDNKVDNINNSNNIGITAINKNTEINGNTEINKNTTMNENTEINKNTEINTLDIILEDKTSCFRLLFHRLYELLKINPQFDNEIACFQLYKLVSIGLFIEHTHLLFKNSSVDAITWFISSSCPIEILLCGFFDAAASGTNLQQFAKTFALKCLKNKIPLMSLLKKYISNINMLENILPHFVSALTVNECIVLEGLVKNSKFKTVCLRKINFKANSLKEKVTVI